MTLFWRNLNLKVFTFWPERSSHRKTSAIHISVSVIASGALRLIQVLDLYRFELLLKHLILYI
jgi:hypothetical protein